MRETDKIANGFFAFYEKLFSNLRDAPINYLEIGVLNGGSLEWARDFFPKGQISGIDKELPVLIESVSMFQINQADSTGLTLFGETFGAFDIIIDDASHVRDLTENTFNSLYPHLKPDGYYIIEDWGADYLFPGREFVGFETLATELIWKHGGAILKIKSGANLVIIGRCI